MTPTAAQALCERILDALPQTQCTRCGYPDCAAYAQAIADGETINRCAPGGQEGVARLAAITGHPALPLHPDHGAEGPRHVAHIDENWCIGCTLCLDACPTDAIAGSHKRMHTVVEPYCTGCELCIPVCPVDCIHLDNVSGSRTGWSAWSASEAARARTRYSARLARLAQQEPEHLLRQQRKIEEKRAALETLTHTQIARDPQAPERSADAHDAQAEIERKRAVIEAALAKARSRQAAIQSR